MTWLGGWAVWICTAATSAALAFTAPAEARSILFVGNSFTYGAGSPVMTFHAGQVRDLNGAGIGGVPALFKAFSDETGLDYQVALETVGGKDLRYHLDKKRALIDQAFDQVVLQSYSTLDAEHPGDPTSLIRSVAEMARLFHARNPKVEVWLDATWSRADQTYPPAGHWHGKPIGQMALDVNAGYEAAAASANRASPGAVRGVAPVGLAFNRAMETGFADPNPYERRRPGLVDLWAEDHYHASSYGYYLEALVIFGAMTGKDPKSLGPGEPAAKALGFSATEAAALQQIAHDQLAASLKSSPQTR
jgi:hypothetical protein